MKNRKSPSVRVRLVIGMLVLGLVAVGGLAPTVAAEDSGGANLGPCVVVDTSSDVPNVIVDPQCDPIPVTYPPT